MGYLYLFLPATEDEKFPGELVKRADECHNTQRRNVLQRGGSRILKRRIYWELGRPNRRAELQV